MQTSSETLTFGASIRYLWHLDPSVVFLNNGSFGATPIEVLEYQHELQRRFECQPLEFVRRYLHSELRSAAEQMAMFMGAKGEDLVFVDNATTGVNAVLRSLMPHLQPGDELLTTSHVYNAVRQAMKYVCDCTGACYVEVPVPFPLKSADEIVAAVARYVHERTRFALFDHVTSPTGVVFPVEDLVRLCKERGVHVMIDGAHAPGMVRLNLQELGVDWYTGNFHKWLFAPKGCAFLWTAPERQPMTHPVVISHGYKSGYIAEFDFTGTRDWSTYLSAPAGLRFLERFGFEHVHNYNTSLARFAQQQLSERLSAKLPVPPHMLGYLAAVPLPQTCQPSQEEADRLHDWLLEHHHIEVPVFYFGSQLLVRTASQIYNDASQYVYLADVLLQWLNSAD